VVLFDPFPGELRRCRVDELIGSLVIELAVSPPQMNGTRDIEVLLLGLVRIDLRAAALGVLGVAAAVWRCTGISQRLRI
jgi:hypothetical protein